MKAAEAAYQKELGIYKPTFLERIKAMEKNYNATLLFGHDIDQILDWAGQGVID